MSLLSIPLELLSAICCELSLRDIVSMGCTCETFKKYMNKSIITYSATYRWEYIYVMIYMHTRHYPLLGYEYEYIEKMTIGSETYDIINYRIGIYTILRLNKDEYTYGYIYTINGHAKYMINVGIYNYAVTTLNTDKYIHIHDFIIEWIRYEMTENATMYRNTSMNDILTKTISKLVDTDICGNFDIDMFMRSKLVIEQLSMADTINKSVT